MHAGAPAVTRPGGAAPSGWQKAERPRGAWKGPRRGEIGPILHPLGERPVVDREERLGEALRGAFAGENPTLGKALTALGDRGFGALVLLLALPAALPLPAVGYAVPFGFGIVCLGVEFAWGREEPWLPRRLLALRLPRVGPNARAFAVLVWLERWVGERRPPIRGPYRLVTGCVLALLGTLMMIPIPGTNTLPGACASVIGLGLLYRDGRLVLAGITLSLGLLAAYVAAVLGIKGLLSSP
ncbi:MAG: exopolysaccharide biosynthesis protein [Caldiserica bacterium]|nr:exopolysaccharide biosynthesis protein [Caldisericota bacterium]